MHTLSAGDFLASASASWHSFKADSRSEIRALPNTTIVVAEVEETGEMAGFGAISNNWRNKILKSCYSKFHFVKEKFQRGRAGVNVGRMLRKKTISMAASKNYRKIYGYATTEAIGFHKKFGAKFFPEYNHPSNIEGATDNYYEIELRPSFLNGLKIEPNIEKILAFSLRK